MAEIGQPGERAVARERIEVMVLPEPTTYACRVARLVVFRAADQRGRREDSPARQETGDAIAPPGRTP